MIYGYFKSTILKLPPKRILYRDYNKLSQKFVTNQLSTPFCDENQLDYDNFENNFTEIFNLHTPFKAKILRGNHTSCR